jgi:hypothetical protein
VGVGLNNAGAQDRLKQVSGPTVVTSVPANSTINDFDVLIPDNFDNLEDALKGVATSLCGGAITIEKLTDEGPDGAYVPAAGWNISAEVVGATNPEDFEWINPVNNTDEQVSGVTAGEPANQNDPPKGTVQFQYQPKSSWNARTRVSGSLRRWMRSSILGPLLSASDASSRDRRDAVEGTLTAWQGVLRCRQRHCRPASELQAVQHAQALVLAPAEGRRGWRYHCGAVDDDREGPGNAPVLGGRWPPGVRSGVGEHRVHPR